MEGVKEAQPRPPERRAANPVFSRGEVWLNRLVLAIILACVAFSGWVLFGAGDWFYPKFKEPVRSFLAWLAGG